MFNINDFEDVKLVCLIPENFINYEEGNGNEIHRLEIFSIQVEKLDELLISTYLHWINQNQPVLRLKSKTPLTSDQTLQAINSFLFSWTKS